MTNFLIGLGMGTGVGIVIALLVAAQLSYQCYKCRRQEKNL